MAAVTGLLIFTLAIIWLVMSAPIGHRTVSRRVVAAVPAQRLWSALHPFGEAFAWNEAASSVIRTGPESGRIITSYLGRDGQPVERDFVIEEEVPGERFTLRFTNDTSLAQSFWENHHMTVAVRAAGEGCAEAVIAERDRYRGVAFLLFRFFALRRMAIKLKRWAETGTYTPGGIFEQPVTQFGMAGLSAMLLWPFFGLHAQGLFLSATLTAVVGFHELGHMAAFRLMGHRTTRMIFIPLLGGIAVGGRPYDRHFEIGFSALMGAGFSAFAVAFLVWWNMATSAGADGLFDEVIVIAALFNLGNLMPVWKFDGGQVVRQIFRSQAGQAAAASAMLAILVATGVAVGFSTNVMILCGVVLAVLSLITTDSGVRPKTALTPMTGLERIALGAALASVTAIHAFAVIWGVRVIFY